ncbi:MAG TPA: thiamine phosphate synthase, partial [Spirochaetes bacterium]|nr:thiamine phosphate synthase [Spirochaetota bacterium]
SKKSFGPPQGVDSLIEVINRVDIPVFALGGIKVHNIEKLKHTGVHGLAVISEIISTDDPMAMTQRILDELSHIS